MEALPNMKALLHFLKNAGVSCAYETVSMSAVRRSRRRPVCKSVPGSVRFETCGGAGARDALVPTEFKSFVSSSAGDRAERVSDMRFAADVESDEIKFDPIKDILEAINTEKDLPGMPD
ncbi:hypothetical protein EVAR_29836_1 [Eumeta japonica]|uniref:Uncharacterized protein n=1 Tax=Eumeta variegata TaxID=151549 RepID=A0A4C1VVK2_EUMVA|nr:hypothetical protein EVAR_29836_1 [Eumeta japonica]